MTRQSLPVIPDSGKASPRRWARVMNQVKAGKMNNVGEVENFDLSTLPFNVTDARVGINSAVLLCPLNDHGEYVRVKSVSNGSFQLAATQLAPLPGGVTSASVRYAILG